MQISVRFRPGSSCTEPRSDTAGCRNLYEMWFQRSTWPGMTEVRDYQVDQRLPNPACAIDEWWMAVEGEGTYPNLTKTALAVLTCFHGPLVEGSFNIMGDLMGGRNFRVELPTYSGLETVKYRLGMERSSEQTRDAAIKLLAVDNPVLAHPPRNLMRNMKLAYITHSTVKQNTREGMQNNSLASLDKQH